MISRNIITDMEDIITNMEDLTSKKIVLFRFKDKE